jgi:hypothetical protein
MLERSTVSRKGREMPGPKRTRRERNDEWAQIKQWTLWTEQELYEAMRPLVLFHETAGEREGFVGWVYVVRVTLESLELTFSML